MGQRPKTAVQAVQVTPGLLISLEVIILKNVRFTLSLNGAATLNIGLLYSESVDAGDSCQWNNNTQGYTTYNSENHYRLKMIDVDGQESYSQGIEIRRVVLEVTFYEIYPNPFENTFFILLNTPYALTLRLCIINLQGKVMWTKNQEITPSTQKLSLSADGIPSGVYALKIEYKDKMKTVLIVKQ